MDGSACSRIISTQFKHDGRPLNGKRQGDKVTTTSYGMTDSYSLAGNVITQNYKRTGEVSKYKVRVYETKYDKDPWQQKMGFLPVPNPDGGTIVFRKSN